MFLITSTVIMLSIIIYRFVVESMYYWEKRGVKRPHWRYYIYVNWFGFFQRRSATHFLQELYKCVPNTRFHGFHQFGRPVLILKDPELIKQIGIKAFDHFTDRRFTFADEDEPLFGKNLLNLKGQKWHDMRTYLSPSFTTNKMKMIFCIMDNCGKKFVQHFSNKKENIIETDIMDAFTRYTNNVIASSVFGIEVDALKDPKNEFYVRGRQATDLTKLSVTLKLMCSIVSPNLYKFLGLQLLPQDTTEFFTKLINDTIKLREEGKIIQTDMIHLLLEAKKEHETQEKTEQSKNAKTCVTSEDILSQAFIFFFAGFEPVGRTMCFMAYELAVNPDIQQRLREEIEEANENCNGQITYDVLTEMRYMDMVVSEVLRKYPIQVATDRICTKPYALETTETEKPINIDVGCYILFPTFSLHRDPDLFPDPDKFDPERFNDDNKSKIKPYAYQPFGIGPRMCIGTRYALMETKLVFFHLLRKFEILPSETTKVPLVFLRSMMTMSSEFGFRFNLKRL